MHLLSLVLCFDCNSVEGKEVEGLLKYFCIFVYFMCIYLFVFIHMYIYI